LIKRRHWRLEASWQVRGWFTAPKRAINDLSGHGGPILPVLAKTGRCLTSLFGRRFLSFMKSIQPIVIIPFGYVILVLILGYFVVSFAVMAAAAAAELAIIVIYFILKWAFFALCFGGSAALVLRGLYELGENIHGVAFIKFQELGNTIFDLDLGRFNGFQLRF
jgi:hypothetical protein